MANATKMAMRMPWAEFKAKVEAGQAASANATKMVMRMPWAEFTAQVTPLTPSGLAIDEGCVPLRSILKPSTKGQKTLKPSTKTTMRACLVTFDLAKNKAGKIVSRKKSTRGRMNPWIVACACAREMLKTPGFVPLTKGSPLHLMAKELHNILKLVCLADLECVSRQLVKTN